MTKLILYHFMACPYCGKVRDYLQHRGIQVEMRDVRANPDFKRELEEISGGAQVPCLSVDGRPLLESDDIVQWFEENWTG